MTKVHRKRSMTYYWLVMAYIHLSQALPDLIRIGGLFGDEEDHSSEVAFRYAIYRINQDKSILPNTKIAYDIQHLPAHNSFLAAKKACNQAGLGVAAIFGPKNHDMAGHINSMCNTLEVPHVEVRIEPDNDEVQLFSMNLYPDTAMLSSAYMSMLKQFKWQKFCVLYGNQNDLLLLQDIIKAPLNSNVEITVRQAGRHNMRETLKEIDKRGIHRIIAHLNADDTYWLMQSALQLGMIDPAHHFILTNLDLESINMENFRHNHVNLTAFRLVHYDSPRVRDILAQMHIYEKHAGVKLLNQSGVITTEAALMYDSVYVLAHALQQVDQSTRLRLVNLTCEGDQAWAFGSSLYNYLNLVEMEGLTGNITFDRGKRTDFSLDVLQLQSKGLKKVGYWRRNSGLQFTHPFEVVHKGGMFGNKTLIVTSILEDPYVMVKDSEYVLKENDQYEGFCVDLLQEVAELVGFKYKIELVGDGNYGMPDQHGQWNGMVREIIDRKADLAVASLTINYLREQVIDFTKPFMNLGISILFKRPKRESPGLFSFLNPLAIEIWLYVIAAYFVVSILMFILARFSPYEWYNAHPCSAETHEMSNMFTLSNSFWFAVGTLMQQGCDINPRAVSTRIVGGMWWFFTLIIISSYTANLAAFLTVERMVSPIESADDLAQQTEISYGTITGGSTMTFFRESKIPTFQRMWAFMESKEPSVFLKKSQEGIDRVNKEKYAFLMESTMIDYTIQRNCKLMQVGGLLDSKGYGIGTPVGSPYRDPISMAILNLQENGRIQMLYNKWWKNTGTCSTDEVTNESKASSLGIANVGGIFVVLSGGLTLAVVCAILEFAWNSKKTAHNERCESCRYNTGYEQSIWSEMLEELRFAIRCHGSTKKPALRRQCSKCLRQNHENSCAVESPNGIIQLKDINHQRRSPVPINRGEPQHFHYHADSHIDTMPNYPPTEYRGALTEYRGAPTEYSKSGTEYRDTQT